MEHRCNHSGQAILTNIFIDNVTIATRLTFKTKWSVLCGIVAWDHEGDDTGQRERGGGGGGGGGWQLFGRAANAVVAARGERGVCPICE